MSGNAYVIPLEDLVFAPLTNVPSATVGTLPSHIERRLAPPVVMGGAAIVISARSKSGEGLAVSSKLHERANLLYDEGFHGLRTNYIGPLSPTVPPSSSRTSLFPLYRSLADLVG
jgi:hypothetical protein